MNFSLRFSKSKSRFGKDSPFFTPSLQEYTQSRARFSSTLETSSSLQRPWYIIMYYSVKRRESRLFFSLVAVNVSRHHRRASEQISKCTCTGVHKTWKNRRLSRGKRSSVRRENFIARDSLFFESTRRCAHLRLFIFPVLFLGLLFIAFTGSLSFCNCSLKCRERGNGGKGVFDYSGAFFRFFSGLLETVFLFYANVKLIFES